MSLFTDVDEIRELTSKLDSLVKRRFREIAKMDAEVIAEYLIEEKGLEEVCRDIDEAISEAEDWIHEDADGNVMYYFDNDLLLAFEPYPESEEVDQDIVKDIVCSGEADNFVEKAVSAYAYELWRAGIRNALEEILKEKCASFR